MVILGIIAAYVAVAGTLAVVIGRVAARSDREYDANLASHEQQEHPVI